jgi:hypothetical protein
MLVKRKKQQSASLADLSRAYSLRIHTPQGTNSATDAACRAQGSYASSKAPELHTGGACYRLTGEIQKAGDALWRPIA